LESFDGGIPMWSYRRFCVLTFAAAGLWLAPSTMVHAACVGLSGTADGMNKATAVARAQNAVTEAIKDYKTQNRIRGATTVTPMLAQPQPYWRASVSPDLYQKPDVVTATSHTICWSGVVSPFVCTAGAKLCW
jgi:hypothetical protein